MATQLQIARANYLEARRHDFAMEDQAQNELLQRQAELKEQKRHSKATEKQAKKELAWNKKYGKSSLKIKRYEAKSGRRIANAKKSEAKTHKKKVAYDYALGKEANAIKAQSVSSQNQHWIRQDHQAFLNFGLDKFTLAWKRTQNALDRKTRLKVAGIDASVKKYSADLQNAATLDRNIKEYKVKMKEATTKAKQLEWKKKLDTAQFKLDKLKVSLDATLRQLQADVQREGNWVKGFTSLFGDLIGASIPKTKSKK